MTINYEKNVLAPTFFSMVFSAMTTDTFRESQDGLCIRYRGDGGLFNLRHLKAVTKVKETVVIELLFADNCALNGSTEQKMQQEMHRFSRACDNFGLIISTRKTEVMYQPVPGQPYQDPHIMVRGQEPRAVDSFTYVSHKLVSLMSLTTRSPSARPCLSV